MVVRVLHPPFKLSKSIHAWLVVFVLFNMSILVLFSCYCMFMMDKKRRLFHVVDVDGPRQ